MENLFIDANGQFSLWFNIVFFILITWSLVWKGIALWKAAQNNSKPWFIAILILNTLGILEILYVFVFSKRSLKA